MVVRAAADGDEEGSGAPRRSTPTRRKKIARERREQEARARGRLVLRLVRDFTAVVTHRGNTVTKTGEAVWTVLAQGSRSSEAATATPVAPRKRRWYTESRSGPRGQDAEGHAFAARLRARELEQALKATDGDAVTAADPARSPTHSPDELLRLLGRVLEDPSGVRASYLRATPKSRASRNQQPR